MAVLAIRAFAVDCKTGVSWQPLKACLGSIRVCVYIWLNPCLLGPFGRDTTTGDEDNCRTVYFLSLAVAIQGDLGGISSFDIHGDPTVVGARWKKWRRSLELFACGKGVTNAVQKKALLHCGGPEMQDVYFAFSPARQPGEVEFMHLQSNSWTGTVLPR